MTEDFLINLIVLLVCLIFVIIKPNYFAIMGLGFFSITFITYIISMLFSISFTTALIILGLLFFAFISYHALREDNSSGK